MIKKWIANREKNRQHEKRTPLNNSTVTLGHLRALIAGQSGQLCTLETQLSMLNPQLKTLAHLTETTANQLKVLSERMIRFFEIYEELIQHQIAQGNHE